MVVLNFLLRKTQHALAGYHKTKLPDKIVLTSLQMKLDVLYIHHTIGKTTSTCSENKLIISGDISDIEQVTAILTRQLKSLAKKYFLPLCEKAAEDIGVTFNRLTIRGQKTRWGSCSSKGNINLNYKLLFVTPQQLHYVIYHEMVHLIHFNHSKMFWSALEQYIPNAREISYEMRRTVIHNNRYLC
jgi:predicted metal-dependent hydrolase